MPRVEIVPLLMRRSCSAALGLASGPLALATVPEQLLLDMPLRDRFDFVATITS